MAKRILIITATVLLLAGIGFLLFPTVSNEVGKIKANGVIDSFEKKAASVTDKVTSEENGGSGKKTVAAETYAEALEKHLIDAEGYPVTAEPQSDGTIIYTRTSDEPVVFKKDLDDLLHDSREYNKGLINNQGTVETTNYAKAALDMDSYGLSNVYAYLSAPSIGLDLPVYLGANDEMMGYGAAHMYGTSLPLDEKDTNVAVAGHTGYIGRIFFDNIRSLDIGDEVTVTNYWQEIEYKVIAKKDVKGNDTRDCFIQKGRQLLTLITCTPLKDGSNGRCVVICEKTNLQTPL